MEKKKGKGLNGWQIGFIFLLIGMCNSATLARHAGGVIFVLLAIFFVVFVFALPFLKNRGE